jgi:UPF0755 protein
MNLKKIVLYVSLVVLAAMAYFGYKVYSIVFIPNTSFNQSEVSVYIPTNSNYEEVKEILLPFLKDMDKFTALAEQKKYNTNVKAGKFILKKDMNTNAIISALRNSVPIKVTFNNQERVEDLAARISTQIEADSTSLMNAFTDESFLKENGFTSENVLAMFIPNTFEFYWNTSAEKFRDKLAKEYIKFWNDERKAKAEKQGLTPIEVSILASIVHKETAKIDERSKVAGVYLNRLKKGMPLQADPTVIYSVKKVNNDFGIVIKRVLNKDLVVNSPYNTYQNAGLPPGPIFMSDVSALEAVLNPEQHNYIYFCASVTNFGYHEFAATVSEHQANARKYYDWLNKQGLMR